MMDSQCHRCIHYTMFQECSAFPGGIPYDIFKSEDEPDWHDHRKPHPDDGGIQFKLAPDQLADVDDDEGST